MDGSGTLRATYVVFLWRLRQLSRTIRKDVYSFDVHFFQLSMLEWNGQVSAQGIEKVFTRA